jgi:DNA-binding NarL/FixJ family response regulator
VVVADDSYLVREGLRHVLDRYRRLTVVRSCEDRDSLTAAIAEDNPDVVVVDIRMPPTHTDEGIQVARTLRATQPNIGVVVLSQYAEPSYALALLEDGSARRAYLLKERVHTPGELVAAVDAVAHGGSVIDPAVVELLVDAQTQAPGGLLSELTPREHDVLAQVAQGKSNAAIAESLVLSKRAVEKHINSIFLKLGLKNEHDVSQRVKAALMFLAGERVGEPDPRG